MHEESNLAYPKSNKKEKIHRFVRKTSDGLNIEKTDSHTHQGFIDKSKMLWEWQLFREPLGFGKTGEKWHAVRVAPAPKEGEKAAVLYDSRAIGLTNQIHEWERNRVEKEEEEAKKKEEEAKIAEGLKQLENNMAT
jgi:hypothetical protein